MTEQMTTEQYRERYRLGAPIPGRASNIRPGIYIILFAVSPFIVFAILIIGGLAGWFDA